MTHAFIFPGQGAQSVGMGRDLAEAYPAAKAVFEEVDEALGEKLSTLIWEGPIEELTLTQNAQPALMATSLAGMAALKSEGVDVGSAKFVAGHSLGEYSALCAAGAISLSDTARLLRARGAAMQKAVPVGEGAMAAILGLDFASVSGIAAESAGDLICQAANDNDPGQVVISGNKQAVEAAALLAREKGAKRAVMLPVSAPFHCEMMGPAAAAMAAELENVDISAPIPPLVSNVSAQAVNSGALIRNLLVDQITGVVRWRESVAWMISNGVSAFVEVGAGKALSGMVRRIDRAAGSQVVNTADNVKSVSANLIEGAL